MILLNTPVSVSVRYTESWELNRWPLDCWTTHRLASWLQYNYQLVSACCSEYLASLWLQSECQWDVTSRQSLQWEGDRPASDLHVIQPAPSKLHLQTSQTSKSLTSVETLLLEHFMTYNQRDLSLGASACMHLYPQCVMHSSTSLAILSAHQRADVKLMLHFHRFVCSGSCYCIFKKNSS